MQIILRDPDFESGVCKIQNGMTDLMTDEEKMDCGKLLLGGEEDSSNSDREGEVSYEERLRKRKRQWDNPSGYMNCSFYTWFCSRGGTVVVGCLTCSYR